jgi:cytochrome b pre-mRNA-processing protein 3
MVIARLRSFISAAPKREAQEVYIALVQQSRKPFFYTECTVPDTLDGRFELIVLHVFLKLRQLKAQGGHKDLSRRLLECLYDDMDRNLREMGVGDMGVARRVKNMSKAAYGRLEAYTQAFGDDAALSEALRRNVWRGAEVGQEPLSLLLNYMKNYGN